MHGVLPWDDDLAIMLKASDSHKIDRCNFTSGRHGDQNIQVSHEIKSGNKSPKLKLSFEFGDQIRHLKCTWYFCDVRTFSENATHVWISQFPRISCYRADCYPLHNRLGKLWMPVAGKPQIWLKKKYGDFRHGSSPYNHRLEHYNRHDHGI